MAALILNDGLRQFDVVGTPGVGVWLIEFNPPIPQQDNTFTESADADGRERLRTKRTNSDGASIVVGIGATTESAFWDAVDEWQEMVESLHRERGVIRYEPPRNGTPVEFDVEAIRVAELPQQGVFLNQLFQASSTATFESLPYGRLDPVAVFSGEVFSGPIDSVEITNVPGHLDALAALTLADSGVATARSHVEVAVEDDYDPSAPGALSLTLASGLTVSGYGGTSQTRAGSSAANVARATLSQTPLIFCATTAQVHRGLWRPRLRVYGTGTGIRVRLAWRVGDGPLERTPWREVRVVNGFYDLPIGTLNIAELPSGHSWTGYVEAYATTGTPTLDVDTLFMLPGARYGRARAPAAVLTPIAFAAQDGFYQAAAPLDGLAAPAGGSWDTTPTGTYDATDFNVDAGLHRASRAAISDAPWQGRYAVLGGSLGAVQTGITVWRTGTGGSPSDPYPLRQGVFARFTDTDNWVMVVSERVVLVDTGTGTFYFANEVVLYKRVGGGTPTRIDSTGYSFSPQQAGAAGYALQLELTTAGGYTVSANGTVLFAGVDTFPASGQCGFYDENQRMYAWGRTYDDFFAAVPPTPNAVIHASRSARFLHNQALRQNIAGTSEGRVPVFEGKHLTLAPTTRGGRRSRLVVKVRQNDSESGEPDAGLNNPTTGALIVTPRITLLSTGEVSGFPSYLLSSVATDRALNCNSCTLHELADVLGTLITDYIANPTSIPAYTFTSATTDRTYNANGTTLHELADVVATVYADLIGAGGTYTATGSITSRIMNANGVSEHGLADVLATFISDLETAGDI